MQTCGATRLDALAPTLCVLINTRTFDHGGSSPSRILASERLSARPQKSIPSSLPVAFPPPAALCEGFPKRYSLFFNGLPDHNIWFRELQYYCRKTIVFPVFSQSFPVVCRNTRLWDLTGGSPLCRSRGASQVDLRRFVRRVDQTKTPRCIPDGVAQRPAQNKRRQEAKEDVQIRNA